MVNQCQLKLNRSAHAISAARGRGVYQPLLFTQSTLTAGEGGERPAPAAACVDGWMDGWMDGWVGGWTDAALCACSVLTLTLQPACYLFA